MRRHLVLGTVAALRALTPDSEGHTASSFVSPVRMRIAGTAEEEAKALLAEVNSPLIQMYPDMFQAAEAASQEANK